MTDPKPSTNDILSKIRAKNAAASADTPPAEAPAAPASDVPKGTSDILAAARAAKPSPAPAATSDILAAIKKPAMPVAAVPAGAAPKSPADIMAAIRAKAGSAPAAPAASAAGVEKPVAPVVKPDVAAATGMSAAEMIKAARSLSTGAPVPPKVVLPSKPLVAKPGVTAAKAAAVSDLDRRTAVGGLLGFVFSPVVIAWSSFVGALSVSGLGLARFMMPNVLVEPPTKFKIGPPNDYAPGTVSTKWQAQFNIWVVNGEVDGARMIYALSTVCTHLGCTPNWLEGEQKFKCPCHGSGFYKTGVNFEGPAPRPLERVGIRLAEDGMLEVDKSVKFQKELGQWLNPSCFVGVS